AQAGMGDGQEKVTPRGCVSKRGVVDVPDAGEERAAEETAPAHEGGRGGGEARGVEGDALRAGRGEDEADRIPPRDPYRGRLEHGPSLRDRHPHQRHAAALHGARDGGEERVRRDGGRCLDGLSAGREEDEDGEDAEGEPHGSSRLRTNTYVARARSCGSVK